MKKILLLVISFLILSFSGNAQLWKLRKLEVSAGPGITQFYGDIGGFSHGENALGFKDLTSLQTRYNINVNARYRIVENISARLNFNFGSFHATDERGSNEGRQFESTTSFFEVAAIGEYYFIKNKGDNSYLMLKGRQSHFRSILSLIDCYGLTGIGAISYNIEPNEALAAKGRKTEGLAAVIPVGVGATFNYSKDFSFGLELAARYAFTDNIEGYSSAYSKRNDFYFFFNLNCIYKIKLRKGLGRF